MNMPKPSSWSNSSQYLLVASPFSENGDTFISSNKFIIHDICLYIQANTKSVWFDILYFWIYLLICFPTSTTWTQTFIISPEENGHDILNGLLAPFFRSLQLNVLYRSIISILTKHRSDYTPLWTHTHPNTLAHPQYSIIPLHSG